MKKIVLGLAFSLATVFAQAQVVATVTRINAPTASTGVIILEDTTGSGNYAPLIKGTITPVFSGTGAATKVTFYNKATGGRIWTGLLASVFVVGAVGTPTTQTVTAKAAFLKANTY